jgi:DNA-binding FadR family transcriptional regulator
LCEQFHVSQPVIRQAIRILESQSIVETRRGRGGGLYFSSPQAGPVSRILALWLLGRRVTFAQLFELEHPLRVSLALLATRSNISGTDHQQLQQLQEKMENNKQVQLIDIIKMERKVSKLADNDMLSLLLKSMTVYKIGRAQYQEIIHDQPRSYTTLNRQFLRGLFSRQETRIEYFCQQKNQFLKSTDLGSMHAC